MSDDKSVAPVIVTVRQLEKAITGREAVLESVGKDDPAVSPAQLAAVMRNVGQALNLLRKAEAEAGAVVLTTAQHECASRLQSLIASGEGGRLDLEPLSSGGLEAKFDTGDWLGWAQVAWVKLMHLEKHPLMRPATAIPAPFPDTARIAVLGDWGTGLYGAPKIGKSVKEDSDPFALLLHLGDVYYSGTEAEVKSRFLNVWPTRPEAINRALNSNHEMYSGGRPYFSKTLPQFGQESSYFALQNKHWTLVGLDVAYKDHNIDNQQVEWLKQILAQAGDRRIVLFSHHQLYSHFEGQGTKLWSHPGFGAILRSKRIFAWYWGHEHRCSIFEDRDSHFGILARCIGHSGMPQSRAKTMTLPQAGEALYGRAEWRRSAARTIEGNTLSSVVVLEGKNPDIPGEEEKFSPHGYAVLTLDGPVLKEQVLSPARDVLYEKIIAS